MLQIDELAAVLHPMPEPGSVTPDDCFADACEQTDRDRKQYADSLEATALGTEEDPLILALQEARAQKSAADQRIRRLLAYALEFHPKRRYPLNDLAGASGYSFSGVRTAYSADEVSLVQGQINRAPFQAVSKDSLEGTQ
ncbi:hypothetical protein [Streptomyces sp. MZ04]|uniref:hypothetical protein n=1 Tax=Streptomyces sp. MZ04 TaxID=2559236 RepID=UPI00107E9D86|nr:hypothetical protein [Streptomyces sp. MZ04]TGA97450.1 hypothetical protein E2651_31400 [Streptomyces sp. MZ04]